MITLLLKFLLEFYFFFDDLRFYGSVLLLFEVFI